MTPLGERLFVKVDSADVTTAGGIVLPTSAQTAPTQGEVVASFEGGTVKVGERIVYGKYAGTPISVENKEHVLLKETDVVGVMKSSRVQDLQPCEGRLLVEVSEVEETTSGGVLLTSASQERPTFGKILAVGPGKKDEEGKVKEPTAKSGTTVLYSKYSGVEFEGEDEKKYIVIQEDDILAELA